MDETNEILAELRKMNNLLLHIALESKAPKDKLAFLHRVGLSYPEIGELMEMKPDAVRMAIQRAKKG